MSAATAEPITEPAESTDDKPATEPTPTDPYAIAEDGLREALAEFGRMVAFGEAWKAHIDAKRAALNKALYEEHKRSGGKSWSHSFGPKARVTFTLKEPEGQVVVADEKKFTDWVQETHPDQVEAVFTVRPAFTKQFLSHCEQADDLEVVHPETGVIVPGLKYKAGGVTAVSGTRWAGDGKDLALAEVFASPLGDLVGLPAPDES